MKTISKPTAVVCRHCHTPFQSTEREGEFCCSGCRFVYHLLHKRGLEDFYQYGETKAPVGSQVFHERSLDWLRDWQQARESDTPGVASGTLRVQGISCAGCVWLIEAIFREHPGAVSCRVNSSEGTIHLRWTAGSRTAADTTGEDPTESGDLPCDLCAYATDIQRFGYLLGAPGVETGRPVRPLTRKLGLCAALALNAMLFALPRYLGLVKGEQYADLFEAIAWLIATLSMVIGGSYFFRRAWAALRRGDLHIDLPISLGLAFAYAGSVVAWRAGSPAFAYFDFVSIFTCLMLFGRWLQERAVENNRQRLLGLRLTAGNVNVLRNGLTTPAKAETLVTGERFSVPRNGLVPVRSRLRESNGVFALNWINGEPAPREFAAGNIVPSGARNLVNGDVELTALEDWSSSQLSRLLAIESARPWRNGNFQKVIRIYLVCILALSAAGFAGWLAAGAGWLLAVQVLVSVLVVSCPCAIGVALPLLDDIAATRLQAFGVYLREGSIWGRLNRVKTILFDKTGTITLENLGLANPEALDALAPATCRILLHLVRDSLHPVAACLREALLSRGVEALESSSPARETVGSGLEWNSGDGLWRLGRSFAGAPAGTILSLDGVVLAAFRFCEELRPDAADQIGLLSRRGFEIFLLSGDAQARVESLTSTLGLPASHGLGGLTPEDKAGLVRSRWQDSALILGDGANDSLAFDAALCRGTPAVDTGLLEYKADFYMLGRGLGGLGELFAMAVRHRRGVRVVLGFAIVYNLLAVSVALAGWMSPLVAAIIMPVSSLISMALAFAALSSSTKTPSIHATALPTS